MLGSLTNPFRIELHSSGATVFVVVTGELDLCTAPRLEHALDQVSRLGRQVVVDLEEVSFMDCAGLRVLLRANDEMLSAGQRLYLTPGSRQVQRLLQLTEVDLVLGFVPPMTVGFEQAA